MKVYIAGDWKSPPLTTCASLESHGHTIVDKWWDHKESCDLPHLKTVISQCDVFVMDMTSDRAQARTHPMGGSHVGLGLAYSLGKQIWVLNPSKPYTSMVKAMVVPDQASLVQALSSS